MNFVYFTLAFVVFAAAILEAKPYHRQRREWDFTTPSYGDWTRRPSWEGFTTGSWKKRGDSKREDSEEDKREYGTTASWRDWTEHSWTDKREDSEEQRDYDTTPSWRDWTEPSWGDYTTRSWKKRGDNKKRELIEEREDNEEQRDYDTTPSWRDWTEPSWGEHTTGSWKKRAAKRDYLRPQKKRQY